jgi:RNA polymerase sigma-70 factor (ECF subfamily)
MTRTSGRETPLDAVDAALVDAARLGDRRALDLLLRRYDARIRRMCHRVGRDLPDVDDLFQETLLGITRNIAQYRGDAAFSTWAYTIARSCANRLRKRSGTAPVASALLGSRAPDDSCDLEDVVGESEVRRAITNAIDGLSEFDRAVLVMRDLEGCSAIETARALGLTVSAVKSRLHRARYTLRAALAPFVAARPDLGIRMVGPVLQPPATMPAAAVARIGARWPRPVGVPNSAVRASI